ncbi:MAG: hypothetical protein KAH21_09120, partial [Spirochaetaceae bacterium]|nr:hypothetical protein [Spirochaetaceae bacterium]
GEFNSDVLYFSVPVISLDSRFQTAIPPDSCRKWLEESSKRIFIPSHLTIRERFFAAAAAWNAGLIPMVSVRRGESAEASVMIKNFRMGLGGINTPEILIRVEEDWDAVSVFRSVLNIPVLTPVSELDTHGALEWASDYSGSVLLIAPDKLSLPSRKQHKISWDSDEFLMLNKKTDGSNGSILLIVPGLLAREAGKAAMRLSRDNYTVAVMALRFSWPLDFKTISDTAIAYDLVVVSDPSDSSGGLKSDLGLFLMSLRETHIAIPGKKLNGKALAEYAVALHREDRFLRTVDDVKKDRWR